MITETFEEDISAFLVSMAILNSSCYIYRHWLIKIMEILRLFPHTTMILFSLLPSLLFFGDSHVPKNGGGQILELSTWPSSFHLDTMIKNWANNINCIID